VRVWGGVGGGLGGGVVGWSGVGGVLFGLWGCWVWCVGVVGGWFGVGVFWGVLSHRPRPQQRMDAQRRTSVSLRARVHSMTTKEKEHHDGDRPRETRILDDRERTAASSSTYTRTSAPNENPIEQQKHAVKIGVLRCAITSIDAPADRTAPNRLERASDPKSGTTGRRPRAVDSPPPKKASAHSTSSRQPHQLVVSGSRGSVPVRHPRNVE